MKKAVVKKPRVSSAKVHKYSDDKPKLADAVITQKEISSVTMTEDEGAKIDPYKSIPDSRTSEISEDASPGISTTITKSSPAVKSLVIRAQADLAIGRTNSAESKIERGLRIEPQNPKLWHLLSQAHYDQTDYQQAITMAKKSIRYSNDDELVAKNWALIKKAGLQSGDTIVVKEANDYIKLNP